MPHSLYICLQDEDKIAAFAIDADTGRLTPQAEVPAAGGPSVMAISPDRRTLYVGHRTMPAISSFRIDHGTGEPHAARDGLAGRTRRRFSPPTAPASICCPPIIKAGVWRSIRSAADGAVGAAVPRLAGHRHRRPRDSDRPLQPVCLCAAHRPPQGQRPGTAEGEPRPQCDHAVQVRCADRPPDPQFAVPGRAERSASARATIAFIPPWTSSISPTSRAAASPAIASTARPARSPPRRRSRPCRTGTPRATPARRSTSPLRGSFSMSATAATTASRGSRSTPPPGI